MQQCARNAGTFHLGLILFGAVAIVMVTPDPTAAQTAPATRRGRPEPKTYFVAPTGNDGNAGTADQPWKTIQRAADTLAPGDTVRIRGGTYPPVKGARSGHYFDRLITFEAEPGEEVIIDGSGADRSTRALFDTNGAEYLIVRGITVRNAPICGIGVYASWQVRLENCRALDSAHSGIIVDKSGFVSVTDCEVEKACQAGGEESVSIKRSQEVVVARNHIHHTGHEGIDVKEGSKHVRVTDNHVHDVERQALYADAWDVATSDIRFERNRVHDCMFGMAACAETGGVLSDVWFVDNVVYRNHGPGMIVADWGSRDHAHPLRGIHFVNNTIADNGGGGRNQNWGGGMVLENASAEDVDVRNNVLSNNLNGQFLIIAGKRPKSWTVENNLVHGQSETIGEKNIIAEAKFADALNGDFRLIDGPKGVGADAAVASGATTRPAR
jgi:hypothetical protein